MGSPFKGKARLAAAVTALAIGGLVGLDAAAASPVHFAINSTADAVDARVGDGACATSSGACTLRAAIQEANALPGADVIDVPAGTYEIAIPPLNQNDITTGDLDITDSVAIRGTGAGAAIVDAGVPIPGSPLDVHGLDRIFEVAVDGGEVSFSGLTLQDGYATEYGGAIANTLAARVTVTASILMRNVAEKAGGAIDNHVGGTVDVRDSTVMNNFAYENGSALNNNRGGLLTVIDTTVSSNSAADVGLDELLMGAGAISNNAELDTSGKIVVTRAEIVDNRAGGGREGATISNDGTGTVTVEDTTFSKNIATGDGGAIFNGAGEVTVADSAFTDNSAQSGGAIYNSVKDGRVSVTRSTFSLNSASARGGAIASGSAGVLTVVDSTFFKNSADDWGGAILNDDKGSATITNSSFRENTGLNGGGFANDGTGLVTVESSTFTKNSALAGTILASGEGGGVHSNSVGDVVVAGGAFIENHARSGGGLANEGGGTLAVTGTRFSGNTADEQGGGILIQSGAVRMVDIDVIGNTADSAIEAGGGISYQGDKLVSIGESAAIENSRIRDNKAKGPGGGIDSRGDGPLALTTTSITGNTASIGGGIHHVGDAPLDVMRSTLSGNFAESGGGIFSDGDGEAMVENTTVSTNRAGQFGGGLLVSSRLVLRNSTVAGNSAASGGGINNGGGDLVGDGSVFLANTIVANSPTGGNCMGTTTSLGGNVDSADTCRLRELSDQPGTDPRLEPLADNGGPTQTHALRAGSPAQERAVCSELDPCPPVDQRGLARPLFAAADAGAYESELEPEGGGGQACTGHFERPLRSDYDSWVSEGAPGANFGSDATLKVESKPGANDRALIHFALPPVPPGCKLVGARLRLHSPSFTAGRTLEALRVDSEWSELGVTWANQPGTAGPAATTDSGLGTREWNVLAQTRDLYALGNEGFLIRDAFENDLGEQSFHSSEKGTDLPPELILEFADPDNPPPPGPCPTTPQSVAADADSWVNEGSPANNFGGDSTLKVKSQAGSQINNNARALVRFPLPELPRGCTSIASATLRMEAASAKDGRVLEALQIAGDWTESGVTWVNQPATTGPAATVPSAEGPLEWNMTSRVLDMYTSANHGFLIRDAEENGIGDEQTLHSRDKLNDFPPELLIVFDDSTPETMIDSGPESPTRELAAEFNFSSDREDATFECSLDGAPFESCSSRHHVGGLAEGDHTFEVRSTRKVRAVDPTPASYDWTVAVPPETSIEGPGSPSASTSATLTFSADDPDATFECSLDGAPFDACESPVGHTNLDDGEHVFRVRGIDPRGNVEPDPASHVWTVAVSPVVTIVRAPADPSNDPAPSFEFTAGDNGPLPAALVFDCSIDGVAIAACGSPQQVGRLGDGSHKFEVTATDAAGNVSAPAGHGWTIDTVAPEATIDAGPDRITSKTAATFAFGSEAGAALECQLDGGGWEPCSSPHTVGELGPLGDGAHTFEVRATDNAGNTGAAASHSWTVDTVPPDATIDSGPNPITNETAATFAFSSEAGAALECQLDGAGWEPCTSPRTVGELVRLADGTHSFGVRATDAAGNIGVPAVYSWTVDTVPPEATIDAGPDPVTNKTAARFAFSSEADAALECQLDGGGWQPCASPHTVGDVIPLADGTHTFEFRATDAAANSGAAASYSWAVDTVPPFATIDSGPDPVTNKTAATFHFSSEADAALECQLDGAGWQPCSSPHNVGELVPLTDGAHTFEVRATDKAGNTGAAAAYSWTVDTVAPEATIDSGPNPLTNTTAATFAFSSQADAALECQFDAGGWQPCTSPHTVGELVPLDNGTHTFEVRATDSAGNTGPAAAHSWTVDTIAPDATIAHGPNPITNLTAATFEFSNEADAALECQLDGAGWQPCSSPQTVGDLVPLTGGAHTFEVRATDKAGNTGAAAAHSWTVDTVPPEATIDSGPDALINETAATFAFSSEADAALECQLDGGGWQPCASPHSVGDLVPLTDGTHSFEVRATDAAGNTGAAASYSWTVDTVSPEATIDAGPDPVTNETAATFAFSSEADAALECQLDGAGWQPCTSPHSVRDLVPLTDGTHTFQIRATDKAGNTGAAAAHSWTVDTVPPETTIISGPDPLTNETAATFAFSSEADAALECQLDGAGWQPCTSPHSVGDLVPLTDGTHSFEVHATDKAGNTGSPASYSWTVDTVPPEATIDAGPDPVTNETAATFAFASEADTKLECQLDGAGWEPCTSPQTVGELVPLADGTHTFQVRATDAAGNTGAAAAYSWTVDTVAPDATIDIGPDPLTNETAATLAFGGEPDASLECRLDVADWQPCTSPHTVGDLVPLADGTHTFEVRATDNSGNTGAPASYAWTVDTIAPEATIISGPDPVTNETAATFEFSSEADANFECRLDGTSWQPCASPHTAGDNVPLAAAKHTFEVRATDAAGNTGATAAYSWTIDTTVPDTTPPDTAIDHGPDALTNNAAATFEFSSEPGASFECRVDNDAFVACPSPHTTAALADGAHTFEVRATDAADNTDPTPASFTWTIDTTAPETTIGSGPSGLTSDTTPTYEFSSEPGASFQCRVDNNAFAACTSPHTTAALTDGAHTFEVRATDAAGNTDATPANRAITIDTTAPQTTINAGPSGLTNDATPAYEFSSEPGASFQCRVDNNAFVACTSPHTTAALTDGAHTFEVRAGDAAGNTDATPASRSITVDTGAPQTTIDAGPSGLTNDSTPTFSFSSEPGASFQCRVDTAAFAACTSPHTTAPLASGAHTFEVRATDAAGNTDLSPASRAITVDTTAPQTTITQAPPATTTSTTAQFAFSSSETGSTFECSLDGAAFASCTSPQTYTGLANSAHTFSVRARDAAGNVDATPATQSWTITPPQQGCGPAVAAPAAADAWIDENSPTNNNGTDSILKVQSKGPRDNFRALVRFTLPAVPQGCAIESATLRLFAASSKTPRTIQALRLAGPWAENQVNWGNQPATIGAPAETAAGTGYREWSVTSQVQAMYAGANNGFLIRDSVEGQDSEQQFHSREKGQSPPQLVIRFAATSP